MTQQEFQKRVGMSVSADEFAAINTVYMASDVDKDEFCMYWKKMNLTRIQLAKREAREANERMKRQEAIFDIYEKYQSRRGGLNDFADSVMTKRERSVLDIAEIKTERRLMLSVMYEMRKFLHMA